MTEIHHLIYEINEYCKSNYITGYHYTRTSPQCIVEKGLLLRSGDEIRSDFLNEHGHIFTGNEIKVMNNFWKYIKSQKNIRDNRIWFNFTLEALSGSGAESLLNNFGGEQVYFAIDHNNGIRKKLQSIGEPLVIKSKISPKNIKFHGYDWGQIIVSSYHKSLKPEISQLDTDAYQCVPVPPEHVEVYRVKEDYSLELIS